jgi:hypothetical protein
LAQDGIEKKDAPKKEEIRKRRRDPGGGTTREIKIVSMTRR